MIKRIELINFMSHPHTVIEPAAGLTVLVGPNNCGKSAVVTALQILCQNENSTYVVRHGEKEATVLVETDDGHVVEWHRKADSPRYVIDGETFDRLGGKLPPEVHKALRMPMVDDFDVHFGEQKDPVFLLNEKGAKPAQFFASSSDAHRLVEMQGLHRQRTADAQRDKNRLDIEAAKLKAELGALESIVGIAPPLMKLEAEFVALTDATESMQRLAAAQTGLRNQLATRDRHERIARHLDALAPLPDFIDTAALVDIQQEMRALEAIVRQRRLEHESLEKLRDAPRVAEVGPLAQCVAKLNDAADKVGIQGERFETLRELEPLPDFADAEHLAEMLDRLRAASHEMEQSSTLKHLLAASVEPPLLPDPEALTDALAGLRKATDAVKEYRSQAKTAEAEFADAVAQQRQWAIEQGSCPTCGTPLDPDRFVEQMGGHAHAGV